MCLSFKGNSSIWFGKPRSWCSLSLFLRWIMGYVNIENRSFCSRGRGPKERFGDYSVMKWPSNLPSNVEKWTSWCHVRPDPVKVQGKSFVCSVRSTRTPLDLPNFNLNYEKSSFCEKLDFSRFTNRCLRSDEALLHAPCHNRTSRLTRCNLVKFSSRWLVGPSGST